MDYAPRLIEEGRHQAIKEANEAIRKMNSLISGYQSPNVSIKSKHTLGSLDHLKLSFQPGRVLYKVEGRGNRRTISTCPGAFGPDKYHISHTVMGAYEEALVKYLKGILSLFLLLS